LLGDGANSSCHCLPSYRSALSLHIPGTSIRPSLPLSTDNSAYTASPESPKDGTLEVSNALADCLLSIINLHDAHRFSWLTGYYHPKFLRHSRTYARFILRTKIKNDGPRKPASPDDEPDFYAMPALPDTTLPLGEVKAATIGSSPNLDATQEATRRAQRILAEGRHQLPMVTILRSHSEPYSSILTNSATASSASFGASGMLQNRLLAQELLLEHEQARSGLRGQRTRTWPTMADLAVTGSDRTFDNAGRSWLRMSPPTTRGVDNLVGTTRMLASLNTSLPPLPPSANRFMTAAQSPWQPSDSDRLLRNALLARGRPNTNSLNPYLSNTAMSSNSMHRRSCSFPPGWAGGER
jgi:hypothetical protein